MASRAVLICILCAIVTAAPAAAQPRAPERPNIVVVMTDDQTLESMSVMPRTQQLIGDQGTTFTRSFVNFSLCCPSRATLFTGQYAHNHRVIGNAPPGGGYYKLDRSNWLPLWLQRAGYRTIHVGKFLNGYGSQDAAEVPPGWSDWHATVDPTTYRYYNYTVNENGTLRTYGSEEEAQFYSTDFLTRRANELIRGAAPDRKPFFLSLAYLAPHSGMPREPDDLPNEATPAVAPRHRNAFAASPLPLPASFNEADVSDKPRLIRDRPLIGPARMARIQEDYQQRLESLLAVDEGVASVVRTLRAVGELDETLLLFTSDNGFFQGEHRVGGGKVLLYEPSIAVPLLMRGPGVPRGAMRHQLVTNADLAPTLVDAAGAQPGRVLDGRSLLGLLEDPTMEPGRELLVEGARDNSGALEFTGLRNYRFAYIEHASGEQELYDLVRDPHQLQSLHAAPAYATTVARLSLRLAALRSCVGRTCRARPRLGIAVRRRGRDRCALNAVVRGTAAGVIQRVRFHVRGRLIETDSRPPYRTHLQRPRRRALVRAVVRLADGRAVTLDRTIRACRRTPDR